MPGDTSLQLGTGPSRNAAPQVISGLPPEGHIRAGSKAKQGAAQGAGVMGGV